jgi:hypothetical protein
MRRSVSVYSHDSNPAIDSPSYFISRSEADTRIDKGYAVYLSTDSIRTRPPGWTPDEEKLIAGGLFTSAWRKAWSDCYLVWQMTPTDAE